MLSHRGTKLYSARALEMGKTSGARTFIFSGIGSGVRADIADAVVRTSESDKSSAFTVSHTTTMTCLAMLAVELGGKGENRPLAADLNGHLNRLPDLIEAALGEEAAVQEWAHSAREAERFYFTGWGPNASTAYEVALKMKETSYAMTEGFQLEQYLHGPFVATHPGCMVTFIIPPGVGRDRALSLMDAAHETGAHTVAIFQDGDTEVLGRADVDIPLPGVAAELTPILYLIPLQLFTYWLAVGLEHNPDVFRLDDPAHLAAREHYRL